VVTKGLREVGESRLKYPTLSIKETSLKLFALFLKCENPANTDYMRDKYRLKCKDFLDICTISEELFSLAEEKGKLPPNLNSFVTSCREKASKGSLAAVQGGLLQRAWSQVRRNHGKN